MMYHIVKYSGQFGFIKPWTAVRDSETFSQQFLTPSIVEGIEKKLFPELLQEQGIKKIRRHRLNYQGIDIQQEKTWAKGGISLYRDKGIWKSNLGILNRGVMLNPVLFLAFETGEDAQKAVKQSICLCRNEDLLFPEYVEQISGTDFDEIEGFELHFTDDTTGFKVGYNRFDNASEMYGELKVYGLPVRQ
ncbi:hypothetical protein AAG747_09030 [Rapidithrix thailandica]|uniref:Uncharacterized protein n=1 Tax=Rapidithrix thailandica TaxID=413964 RepID=A0AAW9RT12_9BACT